MAYKTQLANVTYKTQLINMTYEMQLTHLHKLEFCALSKRLHVCLCSTPVLQIELLKGCLLEQLNEMLVQFSLCLILVGVSAIGPAKFALI